MDYFFEFHWWYILIAFIFFLAFSGKGGIVVTRLTARLKILDDRFIGCLPEADYCIFKEGEPHKFEIEIEDLAIPVGEELEFQINGETLAFVKVTSKNKAKFEQWSDGNVKFPIIKKGDEIDIKYEGEVVLKGTFQLNR